MAGSNRGLTSWESQVMFHLGRIDANLQILMRQSTTFSSKTDDTDARKIKKWRQAFGLMVDVYKATRLVPWGLIFLGLVTGWKYAWPHLQGWLRWLAL